MLMNPQQNNTPVIVRWTTTIKLGLAYGTANPVRPLLGVARRWETDDLRGLVFLAVNLSGEDLFSACPSPPNTSPTPHSPASTFSTHSLSLPSLRISLIPFLPSPISSSTPPPFPPASIPPAATISEAAMLGSHAAGPGDFVRPGDLSRRLERLQLKRGSNSF